MTNRITFVILALGLVACRDDRRAAPRPVAVAPAVLVHATQTDLARELDDADRHGTWSEVRHRWEGQQLTWTVTRQRALCQSADACNVAPFPIMRPATHGWLPALRFAPGEFARLDAACGTAAQCEVTIQGTLSELSVSAELPTSIKLSGVKLVTAAKRS